MGVLEQVVTLALHSLLINVLIENVTDLCVVRISWSIGDYAALIGEHPASLVTRRCGGGAQYGQANPADYN